MHESFFFGPDERQLFASYHPPANAGGQTLTVICPPIFTEYNRTHSILRKLAFSLAEHGHHVIRFDYSGTGDSFGTLEDSTVNDWTEDIRRAVQEGVELTGCSLVRILGVRMGALLACASLGGSSDVDRLVLWDPVSDGPEYQRSLLRRLQAKLSHNQFISRADRRESKLSYSVYNLSESLRDGIASLDASVCKSVPKDKIRVVRTSTSNNFPVPDLPQVLTPTDCQWDSEIESVIMSQPLLESLVSQLIEP